MPTSRAERFRKKLYGLLLPVVGALLGLVYVIVDEETLRVIGIRPSKSVVFVHNIIDFIRSSKRGILAHRSKKRLRF